MKQYLYSIFFCFTIAAHSQDTKSVETTIYSDVISDEQGRPLQGIQVRVRGSGETVTTNFDGEFSVHAKTGDVLIISKNGKRINTFTLNNSNEYRIEDASGTLKASQTIQKKRSPSKMRKIKQYQHLLDSAAYYEKTNSNKSMVFIENALKNSEVKNNSKNLAQAYATLGNVYTNLKQYDLAITSYQTSLDSNPSNEVSLRLANAFYKYKDYNKSITVYNNLLEKSLSNWQKTLVYEGLGDNYKQTNNLVTAQLNYKKALQIAKAHLITPKISDLNAKLGTISIAQGSEADANSYFLNSKEVSKTENISKRAQVNKSIADSYQKSKNYDKEIELRKETLLEFEDAAIEELVVEPISEEKISVRKLNFDIGRAYKNKEAYPEAISYLEKSKASANKFKDVEIEKDAVRQLSELYNKVGNSKKALENYKEYAKLVDQLYKRKESEIEAAISLNKNLLEKQGRINSLEKDRALTQSKQQLTIESSKRQQLIIYSLIGGLVLLLFSMYAMYKSNKQSKLANNLLALKSLRSQMNPHFIFNALNSVNSFISQNDERSANRYLTEFSTLMRSVLNNSEQDFIPLQKEIELLQLYLKLEHSRFKDKFDYTVEIDKKLQTSDFQIPPMLLQPYVENAVWHGLRYKKEKGNLKISMVQKDSETVEICITDDGIGRTQSKALKTDNQLKQQSKGMNNIKKRIGILNQMYQDKVDVFIEDMYADTTGTKVKLTLKKD